MQDDTDTDAAFDPVALTLAIWLGLIVGITGLVRLSEQASAEANLARIANAHSGTAHSGKTLTTLPFIAQPAAFGG